MSSKVYDIKARIITEVEALSIENATDGITDKKGSKLWAEIFIGDMEFGATDLSNYIDGQATLTIDVTGKTAELVQYALEELLGVFLPLSAELTALDVGIIEPLRVTEPFVRESAGLTEYMGQIEYRIDIRYDY